MSHPDPLYDPENSYEDDDMDYHDDTNDPNYDDHNDFYNDSMDGDFDSAMASAGFGTDEDYGYYGDDREDFHADEAIGYVDYYEDGPYDD
jgi:hypothetical protein